MPAPAMWMCCPNLSIEKRFLPATEVRKEHLNPTVQACIRAQAYCTGYVFYPSHSERWSAVSA